MDRQTPPQSQSPGKPAAENPPESVGDAFTNAGAAFGELREYISFYISAQIDSVRHLVRRIGILAGLAVVALIAGGALVVVAIVMICNGIAGGLSQIMHSWIADLITGGIILGVLIAAIYIVMSRITKYSQRLTTEKYEARRQQQRSRFGHDVGQKAD